MLLAVDDKVEGLEPAIPAGIPEIDHADIIIFTVPYKVFFGKFISWLIEILY